MTDPIHARLVAAIEKPVRAYLWTPDDAIDFTPRVLPKVYGDGRALYTLATLNQRPAYWVVRVCSSWSHSNWADSPTFGEHTDNILTALEEEFGDGLCGYSGTSLFHDRRTRMANCGCEDCSSDFVATWPMVWGCDGSAWSRLRWPAGFDTEEDGYLITATAKHSVQTGAGI